MYAVIKTGGRQAKVQEGDVLQVERLRATDEVEFQPVLIAIDDDKIITDRERLAKMAVKAKVVGEVRGKKVDVFHYRNKSGYRKSAGHRQTYTTVEITKIPKTARKAAAKKSEDKPAAKKATKPAKATAKKKVAKKAVKKTAKKATKAKAAKKTAAKKAKKVKKTTAKKKRSR